MPYSTDQITNIPHVLSQPRFATYLQKCDNDRGAALALYQWNLELSSAFVIPLHILEISLRNAVVETLEIVHTSNWPWNQGFIRRLPDPPQGYSPTRDLRNVAGMRSPTMGKVVAELKFVFWEKMFTSRHNKGLWNNNIRTSFPNAPQSMTSDQIRDRVHRDVSKIRKLRNRIAHHEPIFARNCQDDFDKIHELISWRDTITVDWMNSIQCVTRILSEKPLILHN